MFRYSKCSNVQMFKCSNVQMFKCSNIQMFKCSNIKYCNSRTIDNDAAYHSLFKCFSIRGRWKNKEKLHVMHFLPRRTRMAFFVFVFANRLPLSPSPWKYLIRPKSGKLTGHCVLPPCDLLPTRFTISWKLWFRDYSVRLPKEAENIIRRTLFTVNLSA